MSASANPEGEVATGPPAFDALILAGGRGRRLGGQDKPGLDVDGVSLIERVARAVARAERLVVVGPRRPELPRALVTCEQPPGAGPAAAVVAGLSLVQAELVVVLASDLPFLTEPDVFALLHALVSNSPAAAVDGAMFADEQGRKQLLAGAWRTEALRRAASRLSSTEGTSMRRLLDPLVVATVVVEREPAPWWDCDTYEDLATARRQR